MEFDGFDWDEGNRGKCRKHGLTCGAIERLFLRGLFVLPDVSHSREEPRFRAVGRTAGGRGIFVVFTMRRHGQELLLRPISARYMHAKEPARYAQIYETEENSGIPE